jgi:hypothetical protein
MLFSSLLFFIKKLLKLSDKSGDDGIKNQLHWAYVWPLCFLGDEFNSRKSKTKNSRTEATILEKYNVHGLEF